MATFDRFDICAAYNIFAVLWGGDGCAYENGIGVRLSRLHYQPSASDQTLGGMSENAREIYEGIVARRFSTISGYVPCACCGDDCVGTLVIGERAQVPQGTDLCGLCSDAGCEIDADDCQAPCDECGGTHGRHTCTDDDDCADEGA